MHPAASVIFFTVASGAGYGLLAILGLGVALGVAPNDRWFALVATGLALGLVTAGLLASVAHLGRPERAWRALSQWRSSWLSREGVAAVATYVPAVLFGLGWAVLGSTAGWVGLAGVLSAAGAAATVVMTGMIYASLTPVPQWNSPYTVPLYLVLALASGATLHAALLAGFGEAAGVASASAAVLTVAAWTSKRAAWRRNARTPLPVTTNSATGTRGGDGPVDRVAAYGPELRAEGDGVPGGAEACRAVENCLPGQCFRGAGSASCRWCRCCRCGPWRPWLQGCSWGASSSSGGSSSRRRSMW